MSRDHGWKYIHAEVVGTSHGAGASPCQDFADARLIRAQQGESILVLAAADGAGSAKHGEVGARLACNTILECVADYLQKVGEPGLVSRCEINRWLRETVERIRDVAQADGLALREYSSTLLLAVMGEASAFFVQVGDGAIIVDDGADGYQPVFWPQNGDYINATYFLTDERLEENVQFIIIDRVVEEVGVMTDGVQMMGLRYATREAHTPFFRPMFEHLRKVEPGFAPQLSASLAEFLNSPAVNQRTDDDKTLMLATRRSVAPRVAHENQLAEGV